MVSEDKLVNTSDMTIEDVAMIAIGMKKKYNYTPALQRIDLDINKTIVFKYENNDQKRRYRFSFVKENSTIDLRFYEAGVDVDIQYKESMTFKDINPQFLGDFFQDADKNEKHQFKTKYSIQTDTNELKAICSPLIFYKDYKQLVHELWWLSINENSYKFNRGFSIKPLSEIFKYIPLIENIKVPDRELVKSFVNEFQKEILDVDGIQHKKMNISLRPINTIVDCGTPELLVGGLTMFKNSNLFPFKYIRHGGLELVVSILNELKRTSKYFILLQREVLKRMC